MLHPHRRFAAEGRALAPPEIAVLTHPTSASNGSGPGALDYASYVKHVSHA